MNQSSRIWVLLAGALSVIILFGGYVFAVQPALDFSASQDKSLIENNSTLLIETAKLKSLAAGSTNSDLDARVEELQKAIPAELADPTFFAAVNQARVSSGVSVNSITIDPGSEKVGTATGHNVTIAGGGPRDQALDFVRNLQNSSRLILIKSVDFSGQDTAFTFSITGTIFQIEPVASVATAPIEPVAP